MRLAKYLAHAGVASRRAAEGLVAEGRVTVDGEVVADPARDVGDGAAVALDGEPVGPEPREVYALNKPAGVVSTAARRHRLARGFSLPARSRSRSPRAASARCGGWSRRSGTGSRRSSGPRSARSGWPIWPRANRAG